MVEISGPYLVDSNGTPYLKYGYNTVNSDAISYTEKLRSPTNNKKKYNDL